MRRVGERFGTGSPPTEARARAPAQGPWPRAHGVNIEILIAAALLGAFGVAVAGPWGARLSGIGRRSRRRRWRCSPRARRRVQSPLGPAMSGLLWAPGWSRRVCSAPWQEENLGYPVTVTALTITAAWTIGAYIPWCSAP